MSDLRLYVIKCIAREELQVTDLSKLISVAFVKIEFLLKGQAQFIDLFLEIPGYKLRLEVI